MSKIKDALEWLGIDRDASVERCEDGSVYFGLTQVLPKHTLSNWQLVCLRQKNVTFPNAKKVEVITVYATDYEDAEEAGFEEGLNEDEILWIVKTDDKQVALNNWIEA